MNVDEQKPETEKNDRECESGGRTQNVKEWREGETEKKRVIVPHKYNNTEYLTRKQ